MSWQSNPFDLMLQAIYPHCVECSFYVHKKGHCTISYFEAVTYSLSKSEKMLLRGATFGEARLNIIYNLFLSKSLNKMLVNDAFIPKKVELLIRFFEPFWISRVFHFSLGTFGKVEHLPGPLGTSDETYTQSKFDISGSNETMQNALAPLV